MYEFDLLEVNNDRVRVRVRCSTGTYLRSLAHDLGLKLGIGAHVESLRRIAMGEFTIGNAHTLNHLEQLRDRDALVKALIAPEILLSSMPIERVNSETAIRIAHGQDFRISAFGKAKDTKLLKVIDPNGHLIAIAEAKLPLLYHPIVVL